MMLSENHQHLSNLSRNGSGSSGETWNFHLSRNFPRKCSTHLMLLSTETWLWQIGKYPLLRSQWKGNRHQTKCSPAIQVSRSTQRCFMFHLKYLIKCNITISSNNNIQISDSLSQCNRSDLCNVDSSQDIRCTVSV